MIITHQNPDWDAIAGAWLLKQFGGLANEPVEFVNTGNPDKELLAKAVAVVDTGKQLDPNHLLFDHHHLNGPDANGTCAAQQVYMHLWTRGDMDYLEPLIDLIFAGDTGRPEANASRGLGLHAILSGYKAWYKEQNGTYPPDEVVLIYGFGLLDVLEVRLRQQASAHAELAEKVVYKSNDGQVWAIKHGSTGSTFAAYEAGARIVVFEGEPIEVEVLDHEKLTTHGETRALTYPIGIMRAAEWQEPHVGQLAERVAISKPFTDEIGLWFKHPAGFFAGRGTPKAPVFEPPAIDLAVLAEAIDIAWVR